MVLPGLDEERGAVPLQEAMVTTPNRSKRLHNFTLPCLKWGSQRYLRCSNAAGAVSSSSGDRRSTASRSDDSSPSRKMDSEPESNYLTGSRPIPKPRTNGSSGDGIEAMRQKLMLDLKTEADKLKDAILRNEEEEEKEQESPPTARERVRTWNLRTRRAECKGPFGGGSEKPLKIDEKKPISSSPARTDGAVKLPKLRSNSDKTKPRPKFSLQLTKKEIDEDFLKIVGHRPPRRPNKRPKVVQKQMDTLFPGLWLTEVTADMYKVPEDTVNGGGKARQSGKGKAKMHLVESDDDDDYDES